MRYYRMSFFRPVALDFRHFAWHIRFFVFLPDVIPSFRYFAWRFRYFDFSLGVISPGEKTKKRNGTNQPPCLNQCSFSMS